MSQIAKGGTAVILVTHNMLSIQSLCKKCIFLQNGKLVNYGVLDDIVLEYLGLVNKDKTSQSWSFKDAPGSESIKLIKAEVRGFSALPVIRAGESFEFEFIFYSLLEKEFDVTVTFHLLDEI